MKLTRMALIIAAIAAVVIPLLAQTPAVAFEIASVKQHPFQARALGLWLSIFNQVGDSLR